MLSLAIMSQIVFAVKVYIELHLERGDDARQVSIKIIELLLPFE
jgi:hypothetical protein